jgi:hypothetical protein
VPRSSNIGQKIITVIFLSQQQLQNQHVPAFQHFARATNTVTGLSAEETSGQEVNPSIWGQWH